MYFSKKKKLKTTCQLGTKNPTTKKFIVEPSFFTSWTITSLNAHGRTCKKTKVYIYLNISLYENLFENGCIYTCVYIYCLLYTSDAADEEDSVDLGGRRIIKKKI